MTPEQRESTERRLIEINRRLGFLAPLEISDESPPELDSEETDALYEERDLLMKELDENVIECADRRPAFGLRESHPKAAFRDLRKK